MISITQGVMRAFTLIELLVTISVIFLLIALTLPCLSRAYALAAQTRCESNLRQIQISFFSQLDQKIQWTPTLDCPSSSLHYEYKLGTCVFAGDRSLILDPMPFPLSQIDNHTSEPFASCPLHASITIGGKIECHSPSLPASLP